MQRKPFSSSEFKNELMQSQARFAAREENRLRLFGLLKSRGVKHDADNIIAVREKGNSIVFLERGSDKAGYKHVLKHLPEFKQQGIASATLPNVIMNALSQAEIVGEQGGKGRPKRPVYRLGLFDVAITVGNNGFIVGANPTSQFKK